MENLIYAVTELEQENNKDKLLADEHAFSSREKALDFLRRRYDEVRAKAEMGAGALAIDFSDDGWYSVMDQNGDKWEGYVSEGLSVDGRKPERSDSDILKELMDVLMEYNSDRDQEWDFADKHGLSDAGWTKEETEEHQQILDDIQRNRGRIQALIREATGDTTIEF